MQQLYAYTYLFVQNIMALPLKRKIAPYLHNNYDCTIESHTQRKRYNSKKQPQGNLPQYYCLCLNL